MTQTNYGNMCLPYPTREEQNRIVTFLDSKCVEIDALIAAKEKTNALLKERRQSIIYLRENPFRDEIYDYFLGHGYEAGKKADYDYQHALDVVKPCVLQHRVVFTGFGK